MSPPVWRDAVTKKGLSSRVKMFDKNLVDAIIGGKDLDCGLAQLSAKSSVNLVLTRGHGSPLLDLSYVRAVGPALTRQHDFGWPILAAFARVGLLTCPVSPYTTTSFSASAPMVLRCARGDSSPRLSSNDSFAILGGLCAPTSLHALEPLLILSRGLLSLVSNACRLIVERLQLGDYFLRLSGVYLQKPSTSTPVPRQNHHLHVCRTACHRFDHSRRFVLGARLKLVFTRLGVD